MKAQVFGSGRGVIVASKPVPLLPKDPSSLTPNSIVSP
jgi:hypothetical protein